jgi:hypothetical protein
VKRLKLPGNGADTPVHAAHASSALAGFRRIDRHGGIDGPDSFMTRLQVHSVTGTDTGAALALLDAALAGADIRPRMVFAFYGCQHDDWLLHRYLSSRFPDAARLGGSSFGGVMTHGGVMDAASIGVLLIEDSGDFGVAAAPLGTDPACTAERLLLQALEACGCSGELPELIWIYQRPGEEEAVIEGLRRVVGDRCPIVGGSSADDHVDGRWRQLGPDGPMSDGLIVGVLLPSSQIGYAFQSGYEPAGPSGVITAVTGREIVSIDGKPAAGVYNEWIGGRIDRQLLHGGSILSGTTLFPLATDSGCVDGVSHYLLMHPEMATPTGALRTFRHAERGARLYSMKGDRGRLVDRAGRVAGQAVRMLPASRADVAGALVVYCGGCRMAIGDDIHKVSAAVAGQLGDAPFIGCFTFGEQGRFLDRNVHGNLMISAVVFSK